MSSRSRSDEPSFLRVAPRTVLSPGTAITGKLSFDLPVKIDSRFSGEVKASELLVVGPNADVKAKVWARELRIEGSLVGEAYVSGALEILPGGRFQGQVDAGKLRIYPGGVFEGQGNVTEGRDGV